MEIVVHASTRDAGFSLVELMIAIVILATLVSIGVPSFQNTIRDNRLATQTNSLVGTLNFARSESIKRRLPVVVCRTDSGTNCSNNGNGTWESGWIVFVDTNANNQIEAANPAEVFLLHKESIATNSTLRPAAVNVADFVRYGANGLFANAVNAAGGFFLCDGNNPDVNEARNINLNITGQVQTSKNVGVGNCP